MSTESKIKIIKTWFLICFGIFIVLFAFELSAQTANELREKIEDSNKEIQRLEAEISSFRQQLETVGKEKNSLSKAVKELDLTNKKLAVDIKVTENKITSTNLKIQSLSMEIGGKEEKISQNKSAISATLKKIEEMDSLGTLENLISRKSIFDIWRDVEDLRGFQRGVKDKISELKEIKEGLEINKNEAEEARQGLTRLKQELADQKKIVEQTTREKNQLLKETKNQEANYSKLLADRLAKQAAFEKELREYEEQLQFILDPKKLPGRSALSWPLDNIYITQLFGKTVSAKRLYASGSHSGVDFRAGTGTPVKAVADGIVEGSGNTDLTCPGASFGKWVFIRHNNGLATTYAHLSLAKATSGQRVARGQVIGYSGNTGYSTAPHLHVTVYASDGVKVENKPSKACGGKVYTMPIAAISAYLDPLDYLPPYTSSMVKPDL